MIYIYLCIFLIVIFIVIYNITRDNFVLEDPLTDFEASTRYAANKLCVEKGYTPLGDVETGKNFSCSLTKTQCEDYINKGEPFIFRDGKCQIENTQLKELCKKAGLKYEPMNGGTCKTTPESCSAILLPWNELEQDCEYSKKQQVNEYLFGKSLGRTVFRSVF